MLTNILHLYIILYGNRRDIVFPFNSRVNPPAIHMHTHAQTRNTYAHKTHGLLHARAHTRTIPRSLNLSHDALVLSFYR